MALARLGSGNSLQMVGELYGVVENTTSIMVREFCEAIREHLKPRCFLKPTAAQLKQMLMNLKHFIKFPTF